MVRMGPRMGPRVGARRGPVSYPNTIRVPAGFGWTPSWNVIESSPGVFTTDLVTSTLRPASTNVTRYASIARPDNTGDGLSAAAADKSIWAALNAVSDTTTLYILGSADPANPTMYDYDNAWRSAWFVNGNVLVVSDFTTLAPGYAVSSTYMAPGGAYLGAWGLVGGGTPDVYSATLAAAPDTVIDAAVISATTGVATRLALVASAAAVQAAPGSYYWAAGVLYVRRAGSTAPDANLRALRAGVTNGHINTAGITVYVRGLTFEGGGPARAFYVQAATQVTFENCKFTHGQLQGLELSTATAGVTQTLYTINCTFAGNAADGTGTTASGAGTSTRAVEIGCTYRGNSGVGTDQGSSIHKSAGNGAVSAIRINGTFSANKTDGFADVGGTTTWAVGCTFTGEAIGAYVGDTGTAWLQGCTFTGCTTDIDPFDAGATINTASTTYATRAGSGQVALYTP